MPNPRWDHIFQSILRDVLAQTEVVSVGGAGSVGSGRDSLEVLNHTFQLPEPRDRILWNPIRNFNLYGALARFFWMLAGNDRVSDMAFYEPRVRGFSDNALTVPGSNYGTRLFMPEPGLDQIKSIIDRIQTEPGTRRAAAVIYRPEDASRESKDIPCAFGLAFHPRGGRLNMTMIMRSNAAWGLLPYNVFEFTLLGELVSVMVKMPLGTYTHIALSMHVYKSADPKVDEVDLSTKAIAVSSNPLSPIMPAMPPTSFADLRKINEWEANLRYAAKAINVTNYRDYLARCRDGFHEYWAQLCLPLLAFVLFNQKKVEAGLNVLAHVKEPARQLLLQHPMVSGLNVRGLEEDPVLLESRLNLLNFAASRALPEPRRENLWAGFQNEYRKDLAGDNQTTRRRQSAVSLAEWEQRDRAYREPDLFSAE